MVNKTKKITAWKSTFAISMVSYIQACLVVFERSFLQTFLFTDKACHRKLAKPCTQLIILKYFLLLIATILSLSCVAQKEKPITYILIKKTANIPGEINQSVINKLDEPLRAIAAYYSAIAGSNCDQKSCELTIALGLGNQGSEAHKALLQKWFRFDNVAKQLIAQDCFQPPGTASNFSDFVFLTFERIGNNVKIKYKLYVYFHGDVSYITGAPDLFVIKKDIIEVKKRSIWKNFKSPITMDNGKAGLSELN